jgi:hypothetical protein
MGGKMRTGKIFIVGAALSTVSAFSQNPFEKCISFDGNGTYLTIPNIDVLDSCRQFTIECWFKTNNENPCVLMNKMSVTERVTRYDTLFFYNGWVVDLNRVWGHETPYVSAIQADTAKGGIRMISCHSELDSSSYGTLLQQAGWDTLESNEKGKWNHLFMWIDKKYDHQSILFYINGQVKNSTGYHIGLGDWDLSASGYPLNWGGYSPDIDSTLYLNGCLDEVRIWNHTRFLKRIRWAMRDTLVSAAYAGPDSGLIAYYRFDKLEDLGVGGDGCDDIRDLSGNGRHADIVGDASLVESSILTGVDEHPAIVPLSFGIMQNYPNPFNPHTTIGFNLKRPAHVKLSVYNLLGERIAVLLDQRMPEGLHEVRWDAANRPSGIYLCRLETGDGTRTIRMLLQK